jgi:dihydroflavonol-4-reductase
MIGMPASTKVLVTGASGFVAMHCILRLLERGYRVRGTLRSLAREAQLRETLQKHAALDDRLEFVQADLLQDAGWPAAVQGCEYVLHVASPFPLEPPKHEDELIVPAREGALRVLRAAAAGGVRRVVLTSSVVAVNEGLPPRQEPFDENDWSDISRSDAYTKSKTIAERAAWDFVNGPENTHGLELAVINPGYIMGPLLDGNFRTSSELIRKLLRREVPGLPQSMVSIVDVRDVADAHQAAMTSPAAAGQRFLCFSDVLWMQEIAQVLNRQFASRGFRVPVGVLPNALVRFIALFDSSVRLTVPYLGKRLNLSNQRIRSVLGWKPRPKEEAINSMAQSLIDHGTI